MLFVHLVEHQFDVFPLAYFVEAMLWVWVNATGGALIGKEGKEGFEKSSFYLRTR